jgi:hypothetical protein
LWKPADKIKPHNDNLQSQYSIQLFCNVGSPLDQSDKLGKVGVIIDDLDKLGEMIRIPLSKNMAK